QQRDWAARVEAGLLPLLNPGDTVMILAGIAYRRDLLGVHRERGVKMEIPMEGLRIGEQLQWLARMNDQQAQGSTESAAAGEDADVLRFYELLDRLEGQVGGAPELRSCTGSMPWPDRGVYFFFEPEEYRADE